MPKYYTFPKQPASESDNCPEVPKTVTVWGDAASVEGAKNDRHAATIVLSRVLSSDPMLNENHPEFKKPEPKSIQRKAKKSSPSKK